MEKHAKAPAHALAALTAIIHRLDQHIQADKLALALIRAPANHLNLPEKQQAKAMAASEKSLDAIAQVYHNSLETIRETKTAIATMQAMIATDQQQLADKDIVLAALSRIIEENRASMHASAVAQSALAELAYNDPLTGLPNRRLLQERLDRAYLNHQRTRKHGAVLFIDLDRFKQLNDQYGHEAGDDLLKQVADRLQQGVRETDTVARYGGDEFVVLLCDLAHDLSEARAQANHLAQHILNSLSLPYPLRVNHKQISRQIDYQSYASIGMAMFCDDLSTKSHVLDWADEAMYWGKSEGGHTVRCYDVLNATEKTLADLYALAVINDEETANHGLRTQAYVQALAQRALWMNLYPNEINQQIIERLFKTTPLHDIGKTKIPYAILHKRTPFNDDEWAEMQSHTLLGEQLLQLIQNKNSQLELFLNMAIDIAGGHHECWDGSGYPRGLRGVEIPLSGRLMAFADVYDALISDRSYKKSWSHAEACAEIKRLSGTKLDPLLMQAFLIEAPNFANIAARYQDGALTHLAPPTPPQSPTNP